MAVFIIELPLFLLLAGKGKIPFIISFCIYIILCTYFTFTNRKNNRKARICLKYPFAALMLSLAAATLFFIRWNTSGRIISLSSLAGLSIKQTCLIIAFLLAFLSLPGTDYLIQAGTSLFRKNSDDTEYPFSNRISILFIFLTAALVITLNSTCSPLYPFNRWVDPNTTFTVGKAVLKGYVPYRDLYELKGPLFIFLHTIGAGISFESFLGIWILEVMSAFFYLWLSFEILKLFFRKESLLLLPFIAAITYSGAAFRTGDSAEEFCIPFLMYGLYVGLSSIKTKSLPTVKQFILIGITSSCVFWIKYSMVGFYIGWILFFIILALQIKKMPELIKGTGLITCGLLPVTCLILIYFAGNSSLNIFMDAYFKSNLSSMTKRDLPALLIFTLKNLQNGISNYHTWNPVVFYISAAGLLWAVLKRQWQCLGFLALTYLSTFILVYARNTLPYYSFVMGIFTVFGFFWLAELISAFSNRWKFFELSYSGSSLLIASIFLCIISKNMFWLDTKKEDLMQYKMAEVIKQSGIENPTIFYYGTLDLGINMTAGMIPNMRYFCGFNNINLEESFEEQVKCLNEGCVDFVTAFTIYPDKYPGFPAYDHAGWFIGPTDTSYGYFHYYTRK